MDIGSVLCDEKIMNKKTIAVLGALVLFWGLMQISRAETKATSAETVVMTTQERQPWGLGIATASAVTLTNTAATLWAAFDDGRSLQTYFGISSVDPFNFGFGSVLKVNVVGNQMSAAHLGCGFGLGTWSSPNKFFFNIVGVAGFHFQFPGVKEIQVHADAGPVMRLSSSSNNFSFGAFSPLLGLSLVYLL